MACVQAVKLVSLLPLSASLDVDVNLMAYGERTVTCELQRYSEHFPWRERWVITQGVPMGGGPTRVEHDEIVRAAIMRVGGRPK